jgi:hypothetical protein
VAARYRLETVHSPDRLRWLLHGPVGVLELIAEPRFAALVHHRRADGPRRCDGVRHAECDAEMVDGDDVLARWRSAGGDDQVVEDELVSRYARWQADTGSD